MSLIARRSTRVAITTLVAVDVIALLAFSVQRQTTHTSTTPAAASAELATTLPEIAPTSPAPAPVPAAVLDVAPLTADPADRVTTTPQASSPPAAQASPTPAPSATAVPETRLGSCPVDLPTPTDTGGLKDLIGFAPAFGPFSAEAFAAAAAYAPVLELIGPILAKYPQYAPVVDPIIDPLLTQWEVVLDEGYSVIGPFYAPYRPQVLAAETELSAALAPYSESLAASPAAACVVDVEAVLVGDTTSKKDLR